MSNDFSLLVKLSARRRLALASRRPRFFQQEVQNE